MTETTTLTEAFAEDLAVVKARDEALQRIAVALEKIAAVLETFERS